MKKSVVIRPINLKKVRFDYKAIILFIIFICGIVLGISLYDNSGKDIRDILIRYMETSLDNKINQTYFKTFVTSFVYMVFPIALSYVFGLCATGLPFVWLMPIIYGVINGIVASMYYYSYSAKGVALFALSVLLGNAITAATLIKCCCESSVMSLNIFSAITSKKGSIKNEIYNIKDYTINYLILIIPVIIASFINTTSYRVFYKLFGFVV